MAGQILGDSLATFLVLILTIIMLGLAIVSFFSQRKIKQLSYYFNSTSLLKVSNSIQEEIYIEYNNIELKNLILVQCYIINDGDLEILPADFERPITIKLTGNGTIVRVESPQVKPETLNPKLIVSDGNIEIEPLLLNSRDMIVVNCLVTGNPLYVDVDARIAGIKKLREHEVFPSFGVGKYGFSNSFRLLLGPIILIIGVSLIMAASIFYFVRILGI